MARVLVSAHSDVKRAVSLLADQDGSYGKCVVQFAKGCKRSEAAYMQVGKILDKYIANQVRIQPTADLCHVSLCGSGANRASSCTDQSWLGRTWGNLGQSRKIHERNLYSIILCSFLGLGSSVDVCLVQPLRERIQDAPARIERKITQLEEQAKTLEKKRQNSMPKDFKSYLKNLLWLAFVALLCDPACLPTYNPNLITHPCHSLLHESSSSAIW